MRRAREKRTKLQKRIRVVALVLAAVSALLGGRIYALGRDEEIVSAARSQSTRRVVIAQNRGTIFDCNLQRLTNAETGYKLVVTKNFGQVKTILSKIVPEDRDYALEMAAKGKIFSVGLTGPIHFSGGYTAAYQKPVGEGQLAPHIIGYTDESGGVVGLQKALNDQLEELGGERSLSFGVDATGSPLLSGEITGESDPDLNRGPVLTLDSRVQSLCEEVGGRSIESGAIVVLDSASGEIRGCASFPTYDPGNVAASLSAPHSPLVNKAFEAYAVGSTFKLVTASTAVESGISADTRFTCEGQVTVGDTIYRCHKLQGHGELDMAGAIEKSCNCYFVQLSQQMGDQFLLSLAKDMGFGKKTVFCDGLSAAAGNLPTARQLLQGDMENFSFGQGKLLATPVQLAAMVNVFAQNGVYRQPTLLRGTYQDGQLRAEAPAAARQVIAEETAAAVKEAMLQVTEEGGTGTRAKVEGLSIAGKTATAQTGVFVDGEEQLNAYFSGFFPAENPRYTVVVFCENGGEGSFVAAPIFKELAEGLMALQ